MDSSQPGSTQMQKNPIEALSKEELISKYKGLLGIAKKAKQAKDELAEENRLLKDTLSHNETQKEADKKALLAMKEMVEEFTQNKLQLVTQSSELQKRSKTNDETIIQLRTENESLKRQLKRLEEDNESLLNDIDHMEEQLKQVNNFGIEQKKHLALLELEVNKLKEAESDNTKLKLQISSAQDENKLMKEALNEATKSFSELKGQYNDLKEINTDQRKRFQMLKERFNDVAYKLKQLKECKRILLETQYEYAESVSNWQKEIIEASKGLCSQMNTLKTENQILLQKLQNSEEQNAYRSVDEPPTANFTDIYLMRLKELQKLAKKIHKEEQESNNLLICVKSENILLKEELIKLRLDYETLPGTGKDCGQKENEQTNIEGTEHSSAYKSDVSHFKTDDNVRTLKEEIEGPVEELVYNSKIATEIEQVHNDVDKQANLLQENNALRDDLLQARNMLQTMQNERVEHFNEAAFEKSDSSDNRYDETEELKTQLTLCRQANEELQQRYALKQGEHADLLAEMHELNEALKARGDVISRQQAAQKELVTEMQQTNEGLQQIKEELNKKSNSVNANDTRPVFELDEEMEKARMKILDLERLNAANLDTIQKLRDELQRGRHCETPSDVLSTTTEESSPSAGCGRDADDSFEERYHKLRTLAAKLKKKLQEQQTVYAGELEERQKLHEELKSDYESLKKENESSKSELQTTKKHIESLQHEIEKLSSARKQTNVLNLEIEAAEKSLNEVAAKLASKTTEIESLKEGIVSKEHSIIQLRKEIEILEEAKAAECIHSRELKDQIDRLQTNVKDILHARQKALDANKELEEARDSLSAELADLRFQLADVTSTHVAALNAAVTKSQQVEQQYNDLKIENVNLQSRLKLAECSLEDLRVEFLDYKVKAQTVLRKTQNKDTAKEREQDEELLALRTTVAQLQANVKIYEKELDERARQVAILHEDNVNLQRRSRELMDLVNELKQQNDSMAQEQHQLMQQQQAALKQQRLQMEQLDLCHKEQLQQLESSYGRQLDLLKAERGQLQRQPTTVGSTALHNALPPVNLLLNRTNEQSKIDFLLMEREDAEGSEEAAEALAHIAASRKISTASSRRSQHDFMPLDELLSAPMEAISSTTAVNTSNNSNRSDDGKSKIVEQQQQHVELQATKERLQIQESRVRHLTALLAENEQDLAKLTQMNDMLKEELRRQERSVERQSQMHNSEYLKNIIIKFLTLSSGDERTRLVPVLNTILKLSRTESELLSCVAKGQKVATDVSNRSWGHFLPSWANN